MYSAVVLVMVLSPSTLCLESDEEELGMVADWQPLGLLCFWQSPPLLLEFTSDTTYPTVVFGIDCCIRSMVAELAAIPYGLYQAHPSAGVC